MYNMPIKPILLYFNRSPHFTFHSILITPRCPSFPHYLPPCTTTYLSTPRLKPTDFIRFNPQFWSRASDPPRGPMTLSPSQAWESWAVVKAQAWDASFPPLPIYIYGYRL